MNKLILKAKEGIPYNVHQEKRLIRYLGYDLKDFYIYLSLNMIFIILICIFSFIKNLYFLFLMIPFLFFIFYPLIFKLYKRRRKNYKEALKSFYQMKLKDYLKYEMIYSGFKEELTPRISKNNILLITDGYKFIIYEDFLKPIYKIKNNNYLKVIDSKSINKEPFIINLEDIYSYSLIGIKEDKINIWSLYNIEFEKLKNALKITLKDHSELMLSSYAYDLFKKALPRKELK